MAIQLRFLHIKTGEILGMEDINMSEKQVRLCAEMQEWLEIIALLKQHSLPLGVRNAHYKLTHCNYEYTAEALRTQEPTTLIISDEPKGGFQNRERR